MTYVMTTTPSNGSSTTQSQVLVGGFVWADESDTSYFMRVQVATDAGLSNIIFDREGWGTSGGNGGQVNGTWTTHPLTPGTYYTRFYATYSSGGHISGSPSTITSFTVLDTAPTASQSSPAAGASIAWPENAPYPLTFVWGYSGQYAQSAFQIIIERNDTGAVVHDSGKVLSGGTSYTYSIPTTYRDVTLRWRIRVWSIYDTPSSYTANRTFTMATPPTVATPVTPADNALLSWSGGSPYPLAVTWSFSGSAPQSAYQVIVERASDGLVVADSGSVSSSASGATLNIATTYKDVPLRWKVRVANQFGTFSSYSSYRGVTLATAPTATISTPTAGQVLSVGTPAITGTVSCSPILSVNKIVASLWDGITKVWEKTVTGTFANGASFNISDNNFFMSPKAYTYRVEVTDTQGVVSPTATRNFSVSYTPPPTPGTVAASTASYDALGYVAVTFPDTNRDADFYAWEVEREDSMLDEVGGVISVSAFKSVGFIYVPNAAGYEFRDFTAPSNHQVRYRVRQIALKFNTQVPGSYQTMGSTVTCQTSIYWLTSGINGSSSTVLTFRLGAPSADSFTDSFEESKFNIIGRGAYSERGTYLGVEGTLEVKLRTDANGTARQKRLAFNAFRKAVNTAIMRNPFGDVYEVSTGNISVARLAGVGKSEFVDVTIPYTQIGAAL